jgi:hypothetical protein
VSKLEALRNIFLLIKDAIYKAQDNTNVLDCIGCRTSGKRDLTR